MTDRGQLRSGAAGLPKKHPAADPPAQVTVATDNSTAPHLARTPSQDD
ncbi:hypothetical protein ACFYPT_08965 [Streptomyces sp. NPDC005529]